MKVMRSLLLLVLLYIESNNHLSASREGLEARARNRKIAIDILLDILDMTEKQLEQLYNNMEE